MMTRADRGFTLLEVMVALLLLSLALVALIRLSGLQARAQLQLREASEAQWVAANVLAESRLRRQLPSAGQSNGRSRMGQRDWRWQLQVSQTDEIGLLRLDVRVYPESTEVAEPSAVLTGFYQR